MVRMILSLSRTRLIMKFKQLVSKSPSRYGIIGSEKWIEQLLKYINQVDRSVKIHHVRLWIITHKWITANQRPVLTRDALKSTTTKVESRAKSITQRIPVDLKSKIKTKNKATQTDDLVIIDGQSAQFGSCESAAAGISRVGLKVNDGIGQNGIISRVTEPLGLSPAASPILKQEQGFNFQETDADWSKIQIDKAKCLVLDDQTVKRYLNKLRAADEEKYLNVSIFEDIFPSVDLARVNIGQATGRSNQKIGSPIQVEEVEAVKHDHNYALQAYGRSNQKIGPPIHVLEAVKHDHNYGLQTYSSRAIPILTGIRSNPNQNKYLANTQNSGREMEQNSTSELLQQLRASNSEHVQYMMLQRMNELNRPFFPNRNSNLQDSYIEEIDGLYYDDE